MAKGVAMARLLNLMEAFRSKNEEGLSHGEANIIAFICEREALNKSTTVSDLVACQFHGTPPTVQRKVDALLKNGYLLIRRDVFDKRKQVLMLSETGAAYLQELSEYVSVLFADADGMN